MKFLRDLLSSFSEVFVCIIVFYNASKHASRIYKKINTMFRKEVYLKTFYLLEDKRISYMPCGMIDEENVGTF